VHGIATHHKQLSRLAPALLRMRPTQGLVPSVLCPGVRVQGDKCSQKDSDMTSRNREQRVTHAYYTDLWCTFASRYYLCKTPSVCFCHGGLSRTYPNFSRPYLPTDGACCLILQPSTFPPICSSPGFSLHLLWLYDERTVGRGRSYEMKHSVPFTFALTHGI